MEKGKRLYESFKIACSMYSKLPVPQSDWTEENMWYVMCFFPWIGAVIGLFFAGVWNVKEWLASCGIYYHELFYAAILTVLPIFVTGGIHMDGFLDTCDALSSWQEKEQRLEILKDSHAGAFAILSCAVYLILTCGAMTSLRTELIPVVGLGFLMSRSLSGLSIVTFPMAKGSGLAAMFADRAKKKIVRNTMAVYLVMLAVLMIVVGKLSGLLAVVAAGGIFFYYYKMSVKNFGGITGDLAGWFLQVCELGILLSAVIGGGIFR